MRALVIVDAWEKWVSNPLSHYDEVITTEARAFGHFLNEVCKIERLKGTQIIHSHGNAIPMKEIEVFPEDWTIGDPRITPKQVDEHNIDEIYFCGFHFGHCIHHSGKIVMNHAFGSWSGRPSPAWERGEPPEVNIIVNLSLALRGTDSWGDALTRHSSLDDFNTPGIFRYHLWSSNGIEVIELQRKD